MKSHQLTTGEIERYKSINIDLAKRIHDLTLKIKNEALQKTVSDMRLRISEPYLFVIVGEVKVGKSSFINALLRSDTEICKVAPSPMTDTIQQIIWGEEAKEIIVNQHFKKILHNDDILKEFSIVDTPGTNTIIEHHQEITEEFIPSADLIVFVFDAKNPYRQSAWDFMDVIKEEWRKKIIFVLQQKDLMRPEDLVVNIEGVKEHALKKGIPQPQIFAVSALEESKGLKDTGYPDLRVFIQDNITGGKAGILKIANNLESCSNISSKVAEGLSLRVAQYEADIDFGKELQHTLERHREVAIQKIEKLVQSLLAEYNHLMTKKEMELRDNLSFVSVLKRSIGSIFGKKEAFKQWINQFMESIESGLNKQLHETLKSGIQEISENIKTMVQVVENNIQNSECILKNDNEIFSAIAIKRGEVLTDIQSTFNEFISNADNFYNKRFLDKDYALAPNMAKGTGIAVIGAMITALTNGIVFDITGGVLTAIGLIFAGGSLGWNRRKIVGLFQAQVKQGSTHLESDVREKLVFYIDDLRNKIQKVLEKLDIHLASEKKEIDYLQNALSDINNELASLRTQLLEKFPFVRDFGG